MSIKFCHFEYQTRDNECGAPQQNAERGKPVVTRVGEYFVQIRQNKYRSSKIQCMCLKVNVCLSFQQNPGFKWCREGNLCNIKR